MINIFRSLNIFRNLKFIYIIIIIFLPNRFINGFENKLNFNKEIEITNEFNKFKSDGNTLKYQFKYDPSAKFNTKKNPVLMEGDIINLRKTLLGRTTEVINEIANPILSSHGLYKIFD